MDQQPSGVSSPRSGLPSEKGRSGASMSSSTAKPSSGPLTGLSESDEKPSPSVSEESMPRSSTTDRILDHTTKIGRMAVRHGEDLSEAQKHLIEIRGSLDALASGSNDGANPVIELLELLTTMISNQSTRLDRMESELSRIADAVAPSRR